jgi:nucleotide-binding universal stress UspA family protein
MNILVSVDFSEATPRILQAAAKLTRALSGKLWLLHVAEPEPDFVGYEAGPDVVRDQVAREFRDEHRKLQEYADSMRDEGLPVTALMIQGPVVDTVIAEAERLEADMLVVGSHGYGAVYDLLVGSVSRGILKHAEIPVLVVPVRGLE